MLSRFPLLFHRIRMICLQAMFLVLQHQSISRSMTLVDRMQMSLFTMTHRTEQSSGSWMVGIHLTGDADSGVVSSYTYTCAVNVRISQNSEWCNLRRRNWYIRNELEFPIWIYHPMLQCLNRGWTNRSGPEQWYALQRNHTKD